MSRARLGALVAAFGGLLVASCSLGFDGDSFHDGSSTSSGAVTDAGDARDRQSSASSASSGSSGGGDGSTSKDGSPPTFFDDFNRADGPLGNEWQMESPSAFEIVGGRVKFKAPDYDQEHAKNTRPSGEALLDVRASVEVMLPSTTVHGSPALIVRAKLPIVNGNPGYRLEVYAPDKAALNRYAPGQGNFEDVFPLSPPIGANEPVRLVLTAVQAGADPMGPVNLEAMVVRVSDGVVLGSRSRVDSGGGRFLSGVVGFTDDSCCGKAPGELFDNFAYGPP